MATCALTNQTVVSQFYCRFVSDREGEPARFYAFASPRPSPDNQRPGEEPTVAPTYRAVAEDLAPYTPGTLYWNPRHVYERELAAPYRLRVEPTDVETIEAVLRLGQIVEARVLAPVIGPRGETEEFAPALVPMRVAPPFAR